LLFPGLFGASENEFGQAQTSFCKHLTGFDIHILANLFFFAIFTLSFAKFTSACAKSIKKKYDEVSVNSLSVETPKNIHFPSKNNSGTDTIFHIGQRTHIY